MTQACGAAARRADNTLAIGRSRRYRDAFRRRGLLARPMDMTPRRRDGIEDGKAMKIRNSLKSLKSRHRNCRVVRRKGRIYVINKVQRRYKARQG